MDTSKQRENLDRLIKEGDETISRVAEESHEYTKEQSERMQKAISEHASKFKKNGTVIPESVPTESQDKLPIVEEGE